MRQPRVLGEGGRFVVKRELGSGEFAHVYLVQDRTTGKEVALKLIRPEMGRVRGAERLRREYQALVGIEHPNVPAHFEFFEEGRDCYYTLEFVAGTDIVSFVRSDALAAPRARGGSEFAAPTPAGVRRLRQAWRQVVAGVHALHLGGIVHGDLQPANLQVTFAGRAVVLDFGLSRSAATPAAPGEPYLGRPAYVAPELHAQDSVTTACDWYSLGVVLFQMLTGGLPFAGRAADIFVRKSTLEAPRAGSLVFVPPDLDELCARLLSRDPARRPSGEELVSRPDPAV